MVLSFGTETDDENISNTYWACFTQPLYWVYDQGVVPQSDLSSTIIVVAAIMILPYVG